MEEGLEAWRSSEGSRIKMEAQTKLSSNLPRSPGAVSTKTVTQVAYRLGFGRSLYVWKANEKTFTMVFVGGPNSSRVFRNCQSKLIFRICPGAATSYVGLWALYRVGTH
jgi:hypothetical protein